MRQQVLRLTQQLRARGTTRRPIATRAQSGFTLLEVMIAVSILAISLMGLSLSVSRSLRASQHARLMTQATFLVRQQLGDLENNFIVDGFTDDSGIKEDKGDFPDPAFKNFRWMRTVEKIRLPSQDQPLSRAAEWEQLAAPALAKAGLKPASAGSAPDLIVSLGVRVGVSDADPWADPLWYRWNAPLYHWRFGLPPRAHPMFIERRYEREVGVLLRDRASGSALYEARASLDGATRGDDRLIAALFEAALGDFPQARPQSHEVSVTLPPSP